MHTSAKMNYHKIILQWTTNSLHLNIFLKKFHFLKKCSNMKDNWLDWPTGLDRPHNLSHSCACYRFRDAVWARGWRSPRLRIELPRVLNSVPEVGWARFWVPGRSLARLLLFCSTLALLPDASAWQVAPTNLFILWTQACGRETDRLIFA